MRRLSATMLALAVAVALENFGTTITARIPSSITTIRISTSVNALFAVITTPQRRRDSGQRELDLWSAYNTRGRANITNKARPGLFVMTIPAGKLSVHQFSRANKQSAASHYQLLCGLAASPLLSLGANLPVTLLNHHPVVSSPGGAVASGSIENATSL